MLRDDEERRLDLDVGAAESVIRLEHEGGVDVTGTEEDHADQWETLSNSQKAEIGVMRDDDTVLRCGAGQEN